MQNQPKLAKHQKQRIGLYLPKSLVKKLQKQAKKQDRSLNYSIVKILEKSL